MIDAARHSLSLSIDAVARALAEWTVLAHTERDAGLADRFGAGGRAEWVEEVRMRLAALAEAVAVKRPDVFAGVVRWSAEAYDHRAIARGDLRQSIEVMRDVFRDQMPSSAASAIDPYIDAALVELDRLGERADAGFSTATESRGVPSDREAALLDALVAADRTRALTLLRDAAERDGCTPDAICDELIRPVLREIGRRWHRGELSIADEHAATATCEAALAVLHLEAVPDAAPSRTVLATSVVGELHAVGLRLVAGAFERAGWRTVFLGANTPVDDILTAIAARDIDLLALSTTSVLNLRATASVIATIKASAHAIPILVGGTPFQQYAELWRDVGADAVATSAADAPVVGHQLVTGAGTTT